MKENETVRGARVMTTEEGELYDKFQDFLVDFWNKISWSIHFQERPGVLAGAFEVAADQLFEPRPDNLKKCVIFPAPWGGYLLISKEDMMKILVLGLP